MAASSLARRVGRSSSGEEEEGEEEEVEGCSVSSSSSSPLFFDDDDGDEADAVTVARLLLLAILRHRPSPDPNPRAALSIPWLDPEVEAHEEAARARGIDETDLESPTAELKTTIEVLRSTVRRGKAALLLSLLLVVAMPPLVAEDEARLERSMLVADWEKGTEKILKNCLSFVFFTFFY